MLEPRGRAPGHRSILIALACGALAGVAANRVAGSSSAAARALSVATDAVAHPIGQVFLRLLFLVVVPLVFASLALGVARLGDLRRIGRIGARTLGFFVVCSVFSALLGIFSMHLVQPGAGFDEDVRAGLVHTFGGEASKVELLGQARKGATLRETVDQVLDTALPRNVLDALVRMQMLPLIVLALLFGMALGTLPEERARAVREVLEAVSDAMVWIVGFAMRLAPAAVFCLIFAATARFGLALLEKLSLFVVVVLVGYLLQLFAFYPLVLRLFTRRSPGDFLRRAVPVMVTAFSTSSSNATLPTSLSVAQRDLGVRPEIAGFVLPLGATINMNGTALFEGAVVLFLAQVFGVELDLGRQVLVVVLCVLAAIGAAGVPGGSLPLLTVVLAQVGVPPDGIAVILGVDRLLDMGRTVVNVMGDLACAVWVDALEPQSEAPRSGT